MKIAIISSHGHWADGWLTDAKTLAYFSDTLSKNGLVVEAFEVANLKALTHLLQQLDPHDTLVLPNAYVVDKDGPAAETVWLVEVLEQFQFKTIGSNSATLQQLLQKQTCQQLLQTQGIPVPSFAVVHPSDQGQVDQILQQAQLTYPVIAKLTETSSGIGLDQNSMAHDPAAAVAKVQALLQAFQQPVIVETYLPGHDITIAQIKAGDQTLRLATHIQLQQGTIMGQKERALDWDTQRTMTPVEDPALLAQIPALLSNIWTALAAQDLIRIDGKLAPNGQLHIFDVNGFPGLKMGQNVFPKQCDTCFPDYAPHEVYEAMINTIIWTAAIRHELPVPPRLEAYNLFSLQQRELVDGALSFLS